MDNMWNNKFINILAKLENIMKYKGEHFRARAYKNAQEAILKIKEPIYNIQNLNNVKGIGETIKLKLKEYMDTGTIQAIEKEKNNPLNIFTQIYGVGPKNAKTFIDNNINTIEELRNNQHLLNDTQITGLKYYEDILKRIPRDEINEYFNIILNICNQIGIQKFDIVGSYRRGKSDSGDIDIIISHPNKEPFDKLLDTLCEQEIIIHTLTRGAVKSLTITQLIDKTPRRVDFLYSPPNEYPFSTLYFTGSKEFNVAMRQHCLDIGYTLNEHGLYYMNNGIKGNCVDTTFNTEKDIFDFINIEYKEPCDRIGAISLIIKHNIPTLDIRSAPIVKVKKNKTLKNIKINDPITDIKSFQSIGIEHLNLIDEKQLSNIIDYANNTYHNTLPVMTDNEYDIIKEFIQNKYPNNTTINNIGAPVDKDKITLPYTMPSMDKIKPDTKALPNWIAKYNGPYVISAKLDGISAMYSTEGDKPKLYTRGNGLIGQDISHLIPYLNLPINYKDITIRGEIIMNIDIFNNKYKDSAANPRNLVAGIVNSKKSANIHKFNDIIFIPYEVIKPILKPSNQFEFINDTLKLNPILMYNTTNLTNSLLSDTLIKWRNESKYEIDGIIVTNDNIYERTDKNPKHAFAFKMVLSDQVAEAKVLDVLWAASKHGYLKPRIRIEPVNIGGANIEYATAFNAAYVRDNKLGIGSIVKLIRSGDVIPHILEVTQQSSIPKMPDIAYSWNDTNIDIIVDDILNDKDVNEKIITAFFKGIEVDGLGAGNVKRLINANYDTIGKIINMNKNNFLSIEGFKDKMAEKLSTSIKNKIDNITLVQLMAKSNIFGRGFGERKINLIINDYPDILTMNITNDEKIDKILIINGFARKTAESFVNNIPKFILFINELNLQYKLIVKHDIISIDSTHPLYEKNIVMTGFRNKLLEDKLKNIGANLANSISKNTFILLVKDIEESTGKIDKAKLLNIPIMVPQDFVDKYSI